MNKNSLDKTNQYQQQTVMTPSKNGWDYFLLGWSLAFRPTLRHFVFLPMLANIVIMSALFYWFFSSISHLVDFGLLFVPSWLHWVGHVITFLIILTLAILFCYFFSVVTNIIAAPFNGLLAEQVEAQLTGIPAPDSSWLSLIKDLPRIFYRELQKLLNYLLWATPLLLTYFIPLIGQTVTPIIWFLFTAWWVNIQYADYAFDNHKIAFHNMKRLLQQDRVDNLIFGSLVSLFTMLPLLNLIIMPIAVCGSTAMWVDRYRKQALLANII
ncbi:sulfate transporter CysZ [Orbaceae bacterium ESL0727]|nr:sulfate transporter CysZ [Orbaceae bacterium ESL0727]